MSKRQRLSFFHFEGLPDEILLKIFSLLDIKGVLQCGQISKRLRDISNDKSLWLKLNLTGREVPFDFIAKAVENGCEYLNLNLSWVTGSKKSEEPWKLKHLEISLTVLDPRDSLYCYKESARADLVGVLQNCHFLQKLAVDGLILFLDEIELICQNGKTLQNLSLDRCNIDYYHRTELIKKLITSCPQLTELNISNSRGPMNNNKSCIWLYPHISALVDNLAPNILKLNLSFQNCLRDKHVETLVSRCKKITELDLSSTKITNDSLKSIIKHLNSLEKMDISYTNIDVSMLLQLKLIPTLKILHCRFSEENTKKIKNLKLQLPHISINEVYQKLNIADPNLWENRTKPQDIFPSTLILGPPGSPDGP